MIVDHRPMAVYADNVEVAKDLRKYLRGKTTMSLLPDFYILDISGMSDEDYQYVKFCTIIKVVGEDKSILCLGKIRNIYRQQNDMNELTTISIADGMDFYNSLANASIGRGASIRNTLISVLGGFPLASYLADDARLTRGQVYLDRLPDVVSMLARSVRARAFFTQSQVHVVKHKATSSVLFIPDKEIIENPGLTNGVCVVKTKVKGYPVGLMTQLEGSEKQYRLVMQSLDADCWVGEWNSELTLIDEDAVDDMGSG